MNYLWVCGVLALVAIQGRATPQTDDTPKREMGSIPVCTRVAGRDIIYELDDHERYLYRLTDRLQVVERRMESEFNARFNDMEVRTKEIIKTGLDYLKTNADELLRIHKEQYDKRIMNLEATLDRVLDLEEELHDLKPKPSPGPHEQKNCVEPHIMANAQYTGHQGVAHS